MKLPFTVLLPALLTLASCRHERLGPLLEATLVYTETDFKEKSLLLPVEGDLTLTIEPSGEAKSIVKRGILTDVKRNEDLTDEQYREVLSRVEEWVFRGEKKPDAGGKAYASITYGTRRASWPKDAQLPPELEALVRVLREIPHTLREEPPRR